MKILAVFGISILMVALLSGCRIGYIVSSGFNQFKLMTKKVSFEKALIDPKIDDDTKRKIRLVQDVKLFAEKNISLTSTSNYESFVLLDDRYVAYAVTGSPKNKIEAYKWSFPIVGKVPYLGFPKKPAAEEEKADLEKEGYDAAVRGVSAYSTLGWFSDPLLSSMTAYEDHDLVETIIHETTHATLYIKSNADFNERLAQFVGQKGMEEYYLAKEGPDSQQLKRARLMGEDAKVFSQFITAELKRLDAFYDQNKDNPKLLEIRQKEFEELKANFKSKCVPKFKTDSYRYFADREINNAVLVGYKTYFQDMTPFEKAFAKVGQSWPEFIKYFKTLDGSKDPAADLNAWLAKP